MPPPRAVRIELDQSSESKPSDVLDAMSVYSEVYQVQDMLQILLTKLLEVQPLDPYDYLVSLVRSSPELDALELKTKINRFDLRREKTKKKLIHNFYQRLLILQRTQHKSENAHLESSYLLQQMHLEETREHVKRLFPAHYRNIMDWFIKHEKEMESTITKEHFTEVCLRILATIATV